MSSSVILKLANADEFKLLSECLIPDLSLMVLEYLGLNQAKADLNDEFLECSSQCLKWNFSIVKWATVWSGDGSLLTWVESHKLAEDRERLGKLANKFQAAIFKKNIKGAQDRFLEYAHIPKGSAAAQYVRTNWNNQPACTIV